MIKIEEIQYNKDSVVYMMKYDLTIRIMNKCLWYENFKYFCSIIN